jgi:hypothetical protein
VRPAYPFEATLAQSIPTAASVMTTAVSHPSSLSPGGRIIRPMTALSEPMRISTNRMGTAAMPLSTALQYKARIGSIVEKFRSVPNRVAAPMTQ